ncbi:response regulator [Nocardiopsis alba]|uniref:Response regulator n=1 Tax=Nocardiopsis alba TaxID=53437 RepID=A0A7K2ISZ8_9ACTN|nr:response regulator transcription factor [Nocardiopsis sp. LDBS1602]MEC3893470.1 response regulator transcription factor [Nocardiopsis sp. LDBS1602]MYR33071.1 response regulator [Nocardiopsis alba]
MIRLLLADDQALVRGALASMLELESDITVVAQAGTGDEAVAEARRTRPDVALLDIQMPGKDGLEAAAEIRSRVPECRVLICTTFGRPGYLARAMAAGALGYVVKDAPPEELVEAVRRVGAGFKVVDPVLATESLAYGVNPLTPREREVLREVLAGRVVSETAARLCLSEGTVRNHLSSAIGKTGTRSRSEAAMVADERGWL